MQTIVTAIIFGVLFALDFFFTVPVLLFAANRTEFQGDFFALWGTILLFGAGAGAVWVLLLFSLWWLRRLWGQHCTALMLRCCAILAVFVALVHYGHGHLLLPRFGDFDGREILWDQFVWDRWLDLALWGFAAVAAFALVLRRTELQWWLAGFLLVGQGIAAVPALTSVVREGAASTKQGASNTQRVEDLFALSKHKNVIIIVLDAFESPAFRYIIDRYPQWKDTFQGFTYFRNATAHFPTTFLSIPAILSGQVYTNDEPIPSFLERVLRGQSLPAALNRAAVPMDLVTLGLYCERLPARYCDTIHGLAAADPLGARQREQARLIDLALFRSGPLWFKSWVYNDQQWRMQATFQQRQGPAQHVRSIELAERFTKEITLREVPLAVKFYHLMIPHTPLRLDAECRFSREFRQITPRDYSVQSRCALWLVNQMLTRLKELGVYDDTMVIVTADHGFVINYGDYKRPKNLPELARALPLLLVKPFQSSGQFVIDQAPVELGDIPATIATAAGIPAEFPGIPLFSPKPNDRVRVFRNYAWKNEYWSHGKLPKVSTYQITGDAWNPDHWRRVDDSAPTNLSPHEADHR